MDLKRLIKEPRVIIFILILIASVAAIGPHLVFEPGQPSKLETRIVKGLDLQGGVRATISLENAKPEDMQKSISTLSSRINAFGLREMIIRPVTVSGTNYLQIELAGSTEKQMRDLIEQQGKFEAYIDRPVSLTSGHGVLKAGGQEFDVSVSVADNSSTATVSGNTVGVNQSFTLDAGNTPIKFIYAGTTNTTAVFNALVYTGSDIKQVFRDVQHANVVQTAGGQWEFRFSILTSKESAEKFAKVTQDVPVDFAGAGKSYLQSKIYLYLDDKLVDSLSISAELRGDVLTQPSISGPGDSKADALDKMKKLEAILESGALPTKIDIVSIEEVTPVLGEQFITTAIIAILAAILVVSLIVYVRYRDLRIVVPILLTSTAEVIIIFGAAGLLHWTIDLASIAGILAAIGTGVDAQIIIVDEASRKKEEELSLRRKLQQAFFIIVSSGATTIGAMLPLFIIAGGAIRGFAFTTILGVLIGVLITRPTFSKVIEYVTGDAQ